MSPPRAPVVGDGDGDVDGDRLNGLPLPLLPLPLRLPLVKGELGLRAVLYTRLPAVAFVAFAAAVAAADVAAFVEKAWGLTVRGAEGSHLCCWGCCCGDW